MLAMAAARLGIKTCIYNDELHAPAFQVTPLQIAAPYDDHAMLRGFAEICDVITFEFENLPADSLAFLAGLKPMRPGPHRAANHTRPFYGKILCAVAGADDRAFFQCDFGGRGA